MSDTKIGPSAGSHQPQVNEAERASPAEGAKPFDVGETVAAAAETSPTVATDPAAVVQQIRDGQLDIEQAIEVLLDQALKAHPMIEASEVLRTTIRNTLVELVRDDPTLASLASAMKR